MPGTNTPILQNPTMAQNDTNKFVLFNDAITALEDSANRSTGIDLSAGNVTLTETQLLRYGMLQLNGATVARDLTVPTTVGTSPSSPTNRLFVARNSGTAIVTVTHGGAGATVALAANQAALLHADGTDIVSIAGGSFQTFISLTDTPNSFTSQALKIVRVNAAASTLEFADDVISINNQTGTTYTFVLSDAKTLVRGDNVAAQTYTVPDNATVAYPIGAEIWITQSGVGAITLAPAGGVTINTGSGLATTGQFEVMRLVKVAADVWDLELGAAGGGGGGGATTFASLTDTPGAFTGAAGRIVKVNTGESGLEFLDDVLGINDQTGTAYTFVLADQHKAVRGANAGAQTYTVPTNAAVAYPIGTEIWVTQAGVGAITLDPAVGVTLNSPAGLVTTIQYQTIRLIKVGTDVWDIDTSVAGSGASALGINNQTGTTYTLVLSDASKIVRGSNAAGQSYTVPTNATVAFGVGTEVWVTQAGVGAITLAAAGGVTLNSPSGLVTTAQYQTLRLVKVATDTWDIDVATGGGISTPASAGWTDITSSTLTNADFATGSSGWTVQTGTPAYAASGSGNWGTTPSGQILTGGTSIEVSMAQDIAVTPSMVGRAFAFTGLLKKDFVDTDLARLSIQTIDSGGTIVDTIDQIYVGSSIGSQRHGIVYTVTPDAVTIRLRVRCLRSTGTNNNCGVADVRWYSLNTAQGGTNGGAAITTQTGTTYTPVASDANTYVELDNATATTLTIPPNVFIATDEISFEAKGAGQVTVVAGSGMSLDSRSNALKSAGQFAVWTVKFKTTSSAVIFGDLVV